MKVIGLISGTSIDGIDAALVEITGQDLALEIQLLNAQTYDYPASLKNQITEVCHGQPLSIEELAQLDDTIASQFAIAAQKIQQQFPTAELIGSHGQTVYHRPPVLRKEEGGTRKEEEGTRNEEEGTRNEEIKRQQSGEVAIPSSSSSQDVVRNSFHKEEEETRKKIKKQRNKKVSAQGLPLANDIDPDSILAPPSLFLAPPSLFLFSPSSIGYSMQLGRGEVIANLTGIPTVSNFRVADIAAGGHGAPLVPKIDACLLSHPSKHRAIQNLGGMGNVTYLPPRNQTDWEQKIRGWDTGPGNVLIDLAIHQLTEGKQTYDRNGEWAAKGKPSKKLVRQWLTEDYFLQPPPKSTGRELFNQDYLDRCWQDAKAENLSDADWLATLTELTVASIVHSYQTFLPQIPDEILLCGGGSRNLYLRQRLQAELPSAKILTTDEVGLNADYKEAIAFAILAYWRYYCSFPGNLPQVTSANKSMLLGNIHLPQF